MIMKETVVDRLYNDFQDILKGLDPQFEPSLRITAEETFRKTLLIVAASHFEREVKAHVVSLTKKYSGGNELILELVRKKAVDRQFHTYFDWSPKSQNANSFFALFGEGFKSYMTNRVKEDSAYDESIKAFLELGKQRNQLVHEDFGNFTMEKDSEEIFCLYKKASIFVNSLETSFDGYLFAVQSL